MLQHIKIGQAILAEMLEWIVWKLVGTWVFM